ncbi:MAG TPA: hypothetical protein VFZ78_02920 [Flavisolibacter sp.]
MSLLQKLKRNVFARLYLLPLMLVLLVTILFWKEKFVIYLAVPPLIVVAAIPLVSKRKYLLKVEIGKEEMLVSYVTSRLVRETDILRIERISGTRVERGRLWMGAIPRLRIRYKGRWQEYRICLVDTLSDLQQLTPGHTVSSG